MDDIVFYEPPSASQPLRFPGTVTASHLPPGPIASLPARQTATLVRTLSQKTHTSDRHCRNDKQEAFKPSRNLPNCSNDDDYFPDIEELLSSTLQKSLPASADLNGNDHDGFIDIDELLSGMQQRGSTSVDPDYGGMAANTVHNGIRGGSPTNSSRSTTESSRDPIILSDDEAAGAESETDYSNFEVGLTIKSDSSSPHVADSEGFGSGTTYISDRIIADHQDGDNDNGVVDGARLQFAANLPMSASRSHGTVTLQADPMWVNSEITQGSATYDDLDVIKEAEDDGVDVFADNEDDADTCSKKRSGPSAVSSDSPASDSNITLFEIQDGQLHSAQSPQQGQAAASHHQSDLANDPLPRRRRRQDDAKSVSRKRLRMPALTGPASSACPVALEFNDSERTQPVALLAAPAKEREVHDTDQEMVDDGGSDDSNDEDYDDMSDAAASEIRPPRSRKRVKRAKDMEHNDVEAASTHSLNVSYQATAATSSVGVQESEEIPIDGYLTLKTIGSKVVYCLTFSQKPLQEPGGTSQRPGIPRSVSSSSDKRVSERLPVHERAMSRSVRNSRFSSQEDKLLLQLKGEGLSWDDIADSFPERSKGTLQVHYSTKLKPCPEKSKNTRKPRRSG